MISPSCWVAQSISFSGSRISRWRLPKNSYFGGGHDHSGRMAAVVTPCYRWSLDVEHQVSSLVFVTSKCKFDSLSRHRCRNTPDKSQPVQYGWSFIPVPIGQSARRFSFCGRQADLPLWACRELGDLQLPRTRLIKSGRLAGSHPVSGD